MKFVQKVNYSLLFSLLFFFFSMFFSVIPCQKAPNLPNPEYSSGLCSLNPDTYSSFNGKIRFYGSFESLAQTYLLTLAIWFLVPIILLNLRIRRRK